MDFAYFEHEKTGIVGRAACIYNEKQAKALAGKKAKKIFFYLSKKESYPSEIAKEFGLSLQTVFYYINLLKNAGLIKSQGLMERHGGTAKLYKAVAQAAIILEESCIKTRSKKGLSKTKKDSKLSELLHPIIIDGQLNAKIVSGSHDIHGQFKARARDSYLATEFACFLGSLCKSIVFPVSFIDTMTKNLEEENSNLIIIGGPITNKLAFQLQKYLPVKFEFKSGQWTITSSITGKSYNEESTGLVSLTKHPFHKNRKILFIAGIRNKGTKTAIMAVQQNPKKIFSGNRFNPKIKARIVEGIDLDSDGQIDSVEFRE